ncbi:hypothetical protein [Brackiella oedipodis]|uniref:hypothetical protein n=1 Tax=Brackiella oedipodis TaxID=124225 RepID=UPI00048DCAFF|nr:hypothetical protein [Brackiella oedipodis]
MANNIYDFRGAEPVEYIVQALDIINNSNNNPTTFIFDIDPFHVYRVLRQNGISFSTKRIADHNYEVTVY